MSQSVLLKAAGLYSFPNQLGAQIPQGALAQADNVVINRDGVIESRRGFAVYGTATGNSPTADKTKQLLNYKRRIIRHFGSVLQWDNGSGTFTSFPQALSEVEAGLRIKSVEANGNLFLTSSTGIKKISTLDASGFASANITDAGGIKGLDTALSLNDQTGFLTQDSKVAYRAVWGIKDANTNLILGAPGERAVISNPIENLLGTDFNNLLSELDIAAPVSLVDNLANTNYVSILAIPNFPSGTQIQTGMSALCTKLDLDLGSSTFAATKAAIDALVVDPAPSTAQLLALQGFYDNVVTLLNSLIGAPGSPTIAIAVSLFTSSTKSATVDLTFTIPDLVTPVHFYQVYRTAVANSSVGISLSDVDPGEEFGLVFEANPTPAEITLGVVSLHDTTPEVFRGANLYTNPNSGEGIAQANETPPLAKDISLYKNFLFFGNTKTKFRRKINLLSVSNLVAEVSTLTITDGITSNTYTFSATEDVLLKKVKISTAPTAGQQVDETARSLVRVLNRNDSDIVYAYYLSGINDVPGNILFESRTLGNTAFYFNVGDVSYSDQFNPPIPTTGQAVIADNEVSPNRVYHSKRSQPEAVPLLNFFDVGPKDKKILRTIALRESLLIFKEEGIYRMSGESSPFVVTLLDNSTSLVAPDTAAVLNNQVYAFTSQGVAQIVDTGVSIISRPIEGDLLKLSSNTFSSFPSASFAVAYESDRNYWLFTVTNKTDTVATQCFRYNTFTNSWYKATLSKTCGVVNSQDDLLYLGASDINFIEKERKNFDRTDFADREFSLVVANGSISGNAISLASVANVKERDVVYQSQNLTINQFNRILIKLDQDSGASDGDYVATVSASAGQDLRLKLTALAQKLDLDPGINDSDYEAAISGFGSSPVNCQDAFNVIVVKLNVDTGSNYSNYITSSGIVEYEVVVTSVDSANLRITTEFAYPFIAGNIIVYQHIECEVTYAPQTFGDPSMLKQVRESTIMFERISFSKCTLGFGTDLNPGTQFHTFNGSGNGIYGSNVYGIKTYGGSGSSVPFRTLVPKDKQRCRFMNVKFTHGTAREIFAIFGISLTVVPTSERAYK